MIITFKNKARPAVKKAVEIKTFECFLCFCVWSTIYFGAKILVDFGWFLGDLEVF